MDRYVKSFKQFLVEGYSDDDLVKRGFAPRTAHQKHLIATGLFGKKDPEPAIVQKVSGRFVKKGEPEKKSEPQYLTRNKKPKDSVFKVKAKKIALAAVKMIITGKAK